MSEKCFVVLLQCLRCDEPNTRERLRENPLTLISEIFENMIINSQSAYSIGTSACVHQMLVSFRERSKFKMYMPSNPSKYGLKIMALINAGNN
ncbi:piggyBac transposable element-derived protein 4 [Nephila pilipes]|uniref:PiggyBac transposable element-derived protein 4 n=1 Tax=Nephila pilipes TaxID=299642 RepID=A0A8X6UL50_NEPPI|nr:piggyBac transposable element-derived protein 4 [Nephila pilipes]